MVSHDKKINDLFLYWIISSLILVFLIIIIGGLTRLTNSGLSITEWELFFGILPPLNQETWLTYFEEYKKIPQFKLLNNNMNLDEFKIIFYWEYIHRLIARLIGLFFLLPLIYFYFCNKVKIKYLVICLIVFSLILLQGIVGWYMVKSGLINVITVSHYRLSLHLSIAFIIISILYWMIINIKNKTYKNFFIFSKLNLIFLFLILLIFLQIIFGAFVSGLDAGNIYQTWPMMGSSYFPDDILKIQLKELLNFNNHSLVQFYHRNLAYLITFYIFVLSFFIYKKKMIKLYNSMKLIIFTLFLQIILGIFTLMSGLNIFLASAHQITSVLLVFSAINLYFYYVK
jgi:cytochrome c oxidase assembly protein subunit 15